MFVFKRVDQAREQELNRGAWLVLFQARRIPPHILLLCDGRLYSLSVSGAMPDTPLEKLLTYIHRHRIEVVFAELYLPKSTSVSNLAEAMRRALLKYPSVVPGKYSCLHPIREALTKVYGDVLLQAEFVFDVFSILDKQGALGPAAVLYLEDELARGQFSTPVYGEAEVEAAAREALRKWEEQHKP